MRAYHELLQHIIDHGNDRGSRAGGTRSIFGYQLRHDLSEGFPLLTTKRLPFKTIVTELLWFLKGDTNIKYLLENGVHIWSKDAYRVYKSEDLDPQENDYYSLELFEQMILKDEHFAKRWGDLGPVYGAQWRSWPNYDTANSSDYSTWQYNPIDQITQVIESIKVNPEGRRHIVTAWNPAEIDSMALPPCHCMFQFYVCDGALSCHMYQRSADVFLGVPFNIASYALLTHIIAHQTNLAVGELIISFGDVHIYNNHRDQVAEQLARTLLPLPELIFRPLKSTAFHELVPNDFILSNYDPHPTIKGELSVG